MSCSCVEPELSSWLHSRSPADGTIAMVTYLRITFVPACSSDDTSENRRTSEASRSAYAAGPTVLPGSGRCRRRRNCPRAPRRPMPFDRIALAGRGATRPLRARHSRAPCRRHRPGRRSRAEDVVEYDFVDGDDVRAHRRVRRSPGHVQHRRARSSSRLARYSCTMPMRRVHHQHDAEQRVGRHRAASMITNIAPRIALKRVKMSPRAISRQRSARAHA